MFHKEAKGRFPVRGMDCLVVKEGGDRVQDQQVLATLALQEYENVVAQAEAAVAELTAQSAQAGRDHLRFKHLSSDNVVEDIRAGRSVTYSLDEVESDLVLVR